MSETQTTNLTLSARLRHSSPEQKVSVPVELIATRNLNAEQVQKLEMQLGVVHLNANYLKPLRHVGCGAEQLGIIRTTRGGVLMTPQALLQAIEACDTILTSTEGEYTTRERLKVGRLLGYLFGKSVSLSANRV